MLTVREKDSQMKRTPTSLLAAGCLALALGLGSFSALGSTPQPAWAAEAFGSAPVPSRAAGEYTAADAAGFSQALTEISSLPAGSEATMTVSADIDLTGQSASWGAKDIKLTIKGAEGTAPLLTIDGDRLDVAGQLTLENIHISASTIYANGHALTLGEGFGGGEDGQARMTVYGGADSDLDLGGGSTSLTVLDGVYKLIAGGNAAGTLRGGTYVEFSGSAKFPTAADGEQEGDTSTGSSEGYNLYQAAEYETEWTPGMVSVTTRGHIPYAIYGGGTDADTTGSTTVEMTGGTVYQIFGGGAAFMNPDYKEAGDEDGLVSGNTTVHVTGGEVKSIYGGGYNGIDVYDDVPEDARSSRAVVSGTARVTIEGNAVVPACEQSEDASTSGADPAAVHGGSFHSTVGATELVVGGNARIESGGKEGTGYGYGALFGAGTNDVVLNTTSVTLKDDARIGVDGQPNLNGQYVVSQGYFSSMTPLGYAAQSKCYLGGPAFTYGSEVRNQGNAAYAAAATVEGGQVDVLTVGNKSRNTKQASKSVAGNVLLQQTGGTVAAIEASCISEKQVAVSGNVDVKVSGGTVQNYIMGRYDSSHAADTVIGGKATLELSGTAADGGYRTVPLIENMDAVTVKNGAKIAAVGDWTVNDYEGKYGFSKPNPDHMNAVGDIPFYQVKGLDVEEGAALAISQQHALIEGDITINGQLEIKRSGSGVEAPLTAEGTASGEGALLPFEGTGYGTGSLPKVDEEYVYAKKNGSSMDLTLANAGTSGLYVDVRDEGSTQSAWYIAKEEPQEQLWYYEVYYEYIDENGTSEWILYNDSQGGWALPDATVSIDHDDFDGEDLGWEAVDGSGNEILGTHYVYDEDYPTGETSHRLSATCAEATKENPLKIYYRAAPRTVTYEFEGDAPAYVTPPTKQDTCYAAPVEIAAEPTAPGWEFLGWETDDMSDDLMGNGTFTMPNHDVVFTGTWKRTATALTPQATSLVAYEGGMGTNGTDDDTGNALPEPVWRYQTNDWTLYFNGEKQPAGTAAFTWGYFPTDGESEQVDAAATGVYELRAWALDGDPEVVAQDARGTYYVLELDDTPVVVNDAEGKPVTVRVRDVVNDEAAEALSDEALRPIHEGGHGASGLTRAAGDPCDSSRAHAHAAAGTTYVKNGNPALPVDADHEISLLYDDLIADVLGEREEALDAKARAAVGGSFASGGYETLFKYLDLVDQDDGNLWVTTADGSATTVFIPYTATMTAESDIAVVRFENLTRDYTVGGTDADIDDAVAASNAVELAVTKKADGITFEIPSGKFGPIEVMWQNPDDPDAPVGPDEPDDDQPGDVVPGQGTGNEQVAKPSAPEDGQHAAGTLVETGDNTLFVVAALVVGAAAVFAAAYVLRRRGSHA